MDGRTDKGSYRVACPQLKKPFHFSARLPGSLFVCLPVYFLSYPFLKFSCICHSFLSCKRRDTMKKIGFLALRPPTRLCVFPVVDSVSLFSQLYYYYLRPSESNVSGDRLRSSPFQVAVIFCQITFSLVFLAWFFTS